MLVDNRVGLAVELTPGQAARATAAERHALYRRLGKLLGMQPARDPAARRAQFKALPFSKATVKQDVRARTS